VIVIHHGKLLFDGDLATLVQRFSPHKTIVVALEDGSAGATVSAAQVMRAYGEVVSQEDGRITLRVPKAQTPHVTGRILAELPVLDLTVEDPPIEDVIEQVFAQEAV
jgi:ABC-2 type transport system ATP-binding protein